MEVEGYLFRSWKKLRLTFAMGKITVLKGPSGIGKSTIFHLIRWILYGQGRNITPADNPRAKTVGKITLNQLQIIRRRNPNVVKADVNGKKYEDQEAQDLINSFFGTANLFEMTSWIEQKNVNAFFNLSNSEKLECLRHFAIGEEDPQAYIEKLEEELQILEEQQLAINQEVAILNGKLQAFESLGYSEEQLLSEEDQETLRRWIADHQVKIARQQKRFDQEAKWLIKQDEWEKSLQRLLEIVISPIEAVDEQQISAYQQAKILHRQWLKIKDRLAKLPPNSEQVSSWTVDDYNRVKTQEESYHHHSSTAQKLKIPYSTNELRNWITTKEQKLQALERGLLCNQRSAEINKQNQWLEQLQDLSTNPIVEPLNLQEELSNLSNELTALQKIESELKQMIVCPSCNEKLIYNQGLLQRLGGEYQESMVVKEKITTVQTKYKQLLDQDKAAKKRYSQELQRQTINDKKRLTIEKELAVVEARILDLDQQIATYDVEPLFPSDLQQIQQLKKKISSAKEIKIVELPEISSQEIKNSLQRTENEIRRQQLEKEARSYQTQIQELLKNQDFSLLDTLPQLEQRAKDFQRYQLEIATQEKEKNSLRQKLSTIPSFKPTKIPELKAEVEKWEKELHTAQKAEVYYSLITKFRTVEAKRCQGDSLISNYKRLRQLIIDTECQVYSDTLDNINGLIQEIVSQLFTGELNIALRPFKETKSTKQTKQQLNLEIIYHGAKFDNVRQLSGGEIDRVSLALSLAFLRQTNFPLLLLDETLGSLDEDTRVRAIEVIRQYSDGIVLVIQHESSDDLFDAEINVQEYREDTK